MTQNPRQFFWISKKIFKDVLFYYSHVGEEHYQKILRCWAPTLMGKVSQNLVSQKIENKKEKTMIFSHAIVLDIFLICINLRYELSYETRYLPQLLIL